MLYSESVFNNCSALETFAISGGLKDMGVSAFSGCVNMTSFTFTSASLERIENSAFDGCKALLAFEITGLVKTIGARAFADCEALTLISFQSGLTNIEEASFINCKGLTSIIFETLEIPKTVGEITTFSYSCSIKTVGANAFKGCTSLTTVTIPNSVEFVTDVNSEIQVNNITTVIGEAMFYNCTNLTKVVIESVSTLTLSNTNAFYNSGITSTTGMIIVPRESLAAYKTANNWSVFESRMLASYFQVVFKDYDGEQIGDTQTIVCLGDAILPTSPTRFGYTFSIWDTESTNVKADLVITANYTAITYHVNYSTTYYDKNFNGYTEDLSSTYTIESGEIAITNPLKAGFTLGNWTDSDTQLVVGVNIIIPAGSTGDKSYFAFYSIANYDITYVLGEDTFPIFANPDSYTIEDDEIILQNPSARSGYTFLGWTGTNLSEPTLEVVIPEGSTGDRTYTANWEIFSYTITYELNGGTVNGTNPVKYNTESETKLIINPTKTGFNFIGWSGTGIDGMTMAVHVVPYDTVDKVYTANWETIKHDVKFSDYFFTEIEKVSIVEGENLTKPSDPVKANCLFEGWYTGTDYIHLFVFGQPVTEYTLIIAKFTTIATIDINGVESQKQLTVGKEYEDLGNCRGDNLFVKDGYTLDSWTYNNGTIDIKVVPSTQYNYDTTMKFTAVFVGRKYTGSFVTGDNGTTMQETAELIYGERIVSLPTPTKEGYLFAGWYVGDTKIQVGDVYLYKDNATLTASWEMITTGSTQDDTTMSNGSLIGIIAGSVGGVVVIAGVAVVLIKKKKTGKKLASEDTVSKE